MKSLLEPVLDPSAKMGILDMIGQFEYIQII